MYRADIYHGLSNELPFGIGHAGCKTVVTVHDLIFLRYPSLYSRSARYILRVKTRYACKKADYIVAISRCTKQDIMDFYHIPESKITVIYQSVSPVFFLSVTEQDIETVMGKYGIKNDFILSVGTIEERKNQKLLIHAAKKLGNNLDVVIIGKRTPYQEYLEQLILEMGISDKVRILNGVPNSDLVYFYNGALFSVYVPLFEGFGLPVVEALASGCPVIASKGSCLEEAGGSACIYVDAYDSKALADTMIMLAKDKNKRERMGMEGRRHAENFKDEVMADNLRILYERMLQNV